MKEVELEVFRGEDRNIKVKEEDIALMVFHDVDDALEYIKMRLEKVGDKDESCSVPFTLIPSINSGKRC